MEFEAAMENRRYDYSPIIRRPKIEWPNHGCVALWCLKFRRFIAQ
jgi:hypothetical protein